MTIEPQLLTIEQASAILNIGRTKGYELAQRGALPGVIRIGHSLRVSRRRLEEWIEHESDAKKAPAPLKADAQEARDASHATPTP